jgi:hypothetical protein
MMPQNRTVPIRREGLPSYPSCERELAAPVLSKKEVDRELPEEQCHDERHQEHYHGAEEPRYELGQRAHKVVGGLPHQDPPP